MYPLEIADARDRLLHVELPAMWIIWPFRKKNFGSAWTICNDFRQFIDDDIGRFAIQDETHLPHPKNLIFESLCVLLMTETNTSILETVRQDAFELAFFQKNVGDERLYPLGIDVDALPDDGYPRRKTINPAGKEKYDRFKLIRDLEWERMRATMARLTKAPAAA